MHRAEDAADHPAYLNDEERYHEAGYDSLETAKTFLRLSLVLEGDGKYLLDELSDSALAGTLSPHVEAEVSELTANDASSVTPAVMAVKKKTKRRKKATSSGTDGSDRYVNRTVRAMPSIKTDRPSKFSHTNAFDGLNDLSEEVEDENTTESAENPASSSTAIPSTTSHPDQLEAKMQRLSLSSRKNSKDLLPSWNTDFWKYYGNKLRVNATVEELCDLTLKSRSSQEAFRAPTEEEVTRFTTAPATKQERQSTLWGTFQNWFGGV